MLMDSAQGHQLAVENEGGGEEGRKAWRETGFRGRSGSKIVSGVCVSSDELQDRISSVCEARRPTLCLDP